MSNQSAIVRPIKPNKIVRIENGPVPDSRNICLASIREAPLTSVSVNVVPKTEIATSSNVKGTRKIAQYRNSQAPVNPLAMVYLNRLSDLLFVLARVANGTAFGGDGDVLWVPGASRGQ